MCSRGHIIANLGLAILAKENPALGNKENRGKKSEVKLPDTSGNKQYTNGETSGSNGFGRPTLEPVLCVSPGNILEGVEDGADLLHLKRPSLYVSTPRPTKKRKIPRKLSDVFINIDPFYLDTEVEQETVDNPEEELELVGNTEEELDSVNNTVELEAVDNPEEELDSVNNTVELQAVDNPEEELDSVDNAEELEAVDNPECELYTVENIQYEVYTVKKTVRKLYTVDNPEEELEDADNIEEVLEAVDNPEEELDVVSNPEDELEAVSNPEEEQVYTVDNTVFEQLFTVDNPEEELEAVDNIEEELEAVDNIEEELEAVDNIEEELEFVDNIADDSDYAPGSDNEGTNSNGSLDLDDGNTSTDEGDDGIDEAEPLEGRPKKGRKRKYPNQSRVIRKQLCNSNRDYISAKGKQVSRKEFIDFNCNCPNKCSDLVTVGKREIEFKNFWELGNLNAQTAFIAATVAVKEVARKYVAHVSKRKMTRLYKIGGIIVCKQMFLQTFRISGRRVTSALNKFDSTSLNDQRLSNGGLNKLSEARMDDVLNHINKFPRYKSHYSRSVTEKEYLETGITVRKMYELYKEEYQTPVSKSTYNKIFLSKFNLKSKPLKKDTCNVCDSYKSKVDCEVDEVNKHLLESEHKTHLDKANEAQQKLKTDMALAKTDPTIESLTFDLQKTLPLPRLATNIVFYKRQLWMYNCGIHTGKDNDAYCFVWVEGEAGRGAQEVGSCLKKCIETKVGPGVKTLILWSDSCGGQNRNIKMVLMLKSVLATHPTLETISIRFLMSGHPFLPNDSDFGDIERALKHVQRLEIPEEYMTIMKNCRKRNPLKVVRMEKNDFFSTACAEKAITNRKIDEEKEKINWLLLREIKIEKNAPYVLFMKTNHSDQNYTVVNVEKKKKGRPITVPQNPFELGPLWPHGKPVSDEKLKDLKDMLKLISNPNKRFYQNLNSRSDIEDDVEGYDGALDFDPESQDNE